jgi:hypothetical protein
LDSLGHVVNRHPKTHGDSNGVPNTVVEDPSGPGIIERLTDLLSTPPHKRTWWDELIHPHEASTWEKIFGSDQHTWSEILGGKAADMFATRKPQMHIRAPGWMHSLERSTAWLLLKFVSRLLWFITSQVFTSGLDIALWAYDVLVFVVLFDSLKRLISGAGAPGTTTSPVYRMMRIGTKAYRLALGPDDLPKNYKLARLVLGVTIFAPLLTASILFLVLPAMLFAVMVKNSIAVAFGMGFVGLTHACLHRPLSFLVNPLLIHVILYGYRFIGAACMLLLSRELSKDVQRGVADARVPKYRKSDVDRTGNDAEFEHIRERWNSETDPHDEHFTEHHKVLTRRKRKHSGY